MDEFGQLDVQVVGASADSAEKNRRWAEKLGLRMSLISKDSEQGVPEAFGVARPLTGKTKRTTFLIDADGTLRKVYAKVTPKGHAAEVLAAAKEIWA